MNAQFRIADEYRMPCTVTVPDAPVEEDGKWVEKNRELHFIAVLRDMEPGELKSLQDQILTQLKPVFDLLQNLKNENKQALAEQANAASDAVRGVSDAKPLLEQKLIRVEQLTVYQADGKTELDDEATRDFVLRHPRFREAVEKAFKKLTGDGGASMGNLLRSAAHGHA